MDWSIRKDALMFVENGAQIVQRAITVVCQTLSSQHQGTNAGMRVDQARTYINTPTDPCAIASYVASWLPLSFPPLAWSDRRQETLTTDSNECTP